LTEEVQNDEIIFNEQTDASIFVDPSRGLQLLKRLKELLYNCDARLNFRYVILVSPNWVRKRKWYNEDK
jgi:hypothetical protein